MRADMDKQITECSRHKGYGRKKSRQNRIDAKHEARKIGLDNLPKKGRIREGGWFDFGENLSPLSRFLDSKVGEPWDEVYSEISQNLSKNSTIGAHVFQHIWGYVLLNCVEIDGVPHTPEGKSIPESRRFYYSFYVAQDGVLKRTPQSKPVSLEKMYDVCRDSESTIFRFDYYRRKGGGWQKAILCAPDAPIDKGKCQRILPVEWCKYRKVYVVHRGANIGRASDKATNPWEPRPKVEDCIQHWVYSWKTLSQSEVRRLGLDDVEHFNDFREAKFQRNFNNRPYWNRPSGPLTDEKFQELLRQSKRKENLKKNPLNLTGLLTN